ncbi:MAG TPA: YdeI/OmpD-associated family protein [Chitinophagales bacterium]|nr:YdeI/OmpD-associated family protein [Chitinophagales bacterium]
MRPISFTAELKIIGVNPYVDVPEDILQKIFMAAKKDKGFIPVSGKVNNVPYRQTLVRFKGEWRLYINTSMLPRSPKRIGEVLKLSVAYDPADRSIALHPKLAAALEDNLAAKKVFDKMSPSHQKEIIRYINSLKSEASVERNIARSIQFMLGKERFVGRDPGN